MKEEALLRQLDEENRERRARIPEESSRWVPEPGLATDIWTVLPSDGTGLDYKRLVQFMTEKGHKPRLVYAKILDLVAGGHCYCASADRRLKFEPVCCHVPSCSPWKNASGIHFCKGTDASAVGRGPDPRVGQHGYRTGWRMG